MKKQAVIVVDYQNDFANPDTGSLYVNGGENIATQINQVIQETKNKGGLIIASRELHPTGHISFASNFVNKKPITDALENNQTPGPENFITYQEVKNWTNNSNGIKQNADFTLKELQIYIQTMGDQAVWPDHCVDGSYGSEYYKDLDTSQIDIEVIKGAESNKHPYSAFGGKEKQSGKSLLEILKHNAVEKIKVVGLATDYCDVATTLDGVKDFTVEFIKKASAGVAPETTIQALEDMRNAGVKIID